MKSTRWVFLYDLFETIVFLIGFLAFLFGTLVVFTIEGFPLDPSSMLQAEWQAWNVGKILYLVAIVCFTLAFWRYRCEVRDWVEIWSRWLDRRLQEED